MKVPHLSTSQHTKKEREAVILVNLFISISTAILLDKTTCCDKLQIKNAWKVSSFPIIFHTILFQVTLSSWEVSEHHILWKMYKFFFLFRLFVYMHNTNVIQSFHQEIYQETHSISRSQNPAIWLVESVSSNNSTIRIFLDMDGFVQ